MTREGFFIFHPLAQLFICQIMQTIRGKTIVLVSRTAGIANKISIP
jgi:hypothetical protein